jgi:cell division protein ZapA (FtsZ GTPase activity inhibitor)
MSDEFLIKVKVAGRLYPLSIKRNREEIIRKAAKTISEKVLQYQQKYKDKDIQDFLAMASLQFVVKVLEAEAKTDVSPVLKELEAMEQELSEFIKEEQ